MNGVTYRLYGIGMPWEGKPISRAAAIGLLRSAVKSPAIYVQSMGHRRRTTRVWGLFPRAVNGGCGFNLVAERTREASL